MHRRQLLLKLQAGPGGGESPARPRDTQAFHRRCTHSATGRPEDSAATGQVPQLEAQRGLPCRQVLGEEPRSTAQQVGGDSQVSEPGRGTELHADGQCGWS